ncbi:hypothetical protein JY97_11360 [Alkalispirochaeta odontotermitis]|nr:hypothetical protein JY97_11360 [Alkalispirochaeta odontotermitis]CAB1076596.1 hypothetical protein D1AOALGA4SA_4392 [Olavius algarvensis Delta 1 endosymbiont]
MNIIVFAKQIRHTYARTGDSPESHYINPEDGVYRVNPHDEAALELALRLKDNNGDFGIKLVTLGPMIAAEELRRCLATGADDLFQIEFHEQSSSDIDPLGQPDPWVKSGLMARAVKELRGELVLCGKESLDKGSGQVGALLAHRLNLPFVSAITELWLDDAADAFQVQRSAGRGVREVIACQRPAVFSVDVGRELRLPELPRRQWAESYAIQPLGYATAVEAPKIVCTRRYQPRPRPKVIPAPDSRQHAYDRIMQLLTGSTVEKKGEILSGTPESQVEGIIAFLETHGYLESDSADQ